MATPDVDTIKTMLVILEHTPDDARQVERSRNGVD
jgi:hypothetical protein